MALEIEKSPATPSADERASGFDVAALPALADATMSGSPSSPLLSGARVTIRDAEPEAEPEPDSRVSVLIGMLRGFGFELTPAAPSADWSPAVIEACRRVMVDQSPSILCATKSPETLQIIAMTSRAPATTYAS
ncbi:hypothetical protein MRB53_038192 [Persea americana]|nr:hypothetical protein MRB53_038192 [Persea americana]